MPMAKLLPFWGKSASDTHDAHLLLHHMLDTAAVAGGILRRLPTRSVRLLSTGLIREPVEGPGPMACLAFLAGAHDLGKATPSFQRLWSEGAAVLREAGLPFPAPRSAKVRHGTATAALMARTVADANLPAVPPSVARTVGGHHGALLRYGEASAVEYKAASCMGDVAWAASRADLVGELARRVGLEKNVVLVEDPPVASLIVLAGLISVADWIASDRKRFPPAGLSADTESYTQDLMQRAEQALDDLGWLHLERPNTSDFRHLFPGLGEARPLQAIAGELAKGERPSLLIIEAPTGEGKTEAALLAHHAKSASNPGQGLYYALPTQATSNQMFRRVASHFSQSTPGITPLQLLHGHASIATDVLLARERPSNMIQPDQVDLDGHLPPRGDAPPRVWAAEWFAGHRRGLLSPLGVGTVDQALLATMPTKHFFVRLFGLAGKTVVIDEVHAYDAYMSELLADLIGWLAQLDATVILLSATLPTDRRRALIQAYSGEDAPLEDAPYPRITVVQRGGAAITQSIPAADSLRRTVKVDQIECRPTERDDLESLFRKLLWSLNDGGCAAVILNTVSQAQEAFRVARSLTQDAGEVVLDLLHSQFPVGDRQSREKRLLDRYGKGAADRPRRGIVIGTQVIEQSLDIDFDLMVSSLAPVDLLVQRVGRLHRFPKTSRPAALKEPTLWLLVPPTGELGLPDLPRPDSRVYQPYVLTATWSVLRGRDAIQLPEDAPVLVDTVYSGAWREALPNGCQSAIDRLYDALLLSRRTMVQTADMRALPYLPTFDSVSDRVPHPLDDGGTSSAAAIQARTRLGDLSVPVALFFEGDGEAYLDPQHTRAVPRAPLSYADVAEILERTVDVHAYLLRDVLDQPDLRPWPDSPLLRRSLAVSLDERGEGFLGPVRVTFDPETGVAVRSD